MYKKHFIFWTVYLSNVSMDLHNRLMVSSTKPWSSVLISTKITDSQLERDELADSIVWRWQHTVCLPHLFHLYRFYHVGLGVIPPFSDGRLALHVRRCHHKLYIHFCKYSSSLWFSRFVFIGLRSNQQSMFRFSWLKIQYWERGTWQERLSSHQWCPPM